jgi:hypothetical protein
MAAARARRKGSPVGLARSPWQIVGREPALVHDLFGKLPVEMRNDELVECVIKLAVLTSAEPGPLLWKVVLVHNVAEKNWICPIGET